MWFPIGPDFVNDPYDPSLARARLSRRNEAGRQGAVFGMAVGAPRPAPQAQRLHILCAASVPGASTGTVFRSDDGGMHWTAIFDEPQRDGPTDALAAVAAHPTIDGLVYVLTASGGLFTSSDGGGSWGSRIQIAPPGQVQLFVATDLLVLAGGAGQPATRIYVASLGYIVYSDDGTTWHAASPSNTNALMRLARSVAPGHPLYALYVNSADANAGIYQGDPFAAAPTLSRMAGSVAGFTNGRIDSCQNGRVYAYLINQSSGTAGVYTAAGPTDTLVSPAPPASVPALDAGSPNWGLALAVPPNSPGDGATDIVLVGTLALWRTT